MYFTGITFLHLIIITTYQIYVALQITNLQITYIIYNIYSVQNVYSSLLQFNKSSGEKQNRHNSSSIIKQFSSVGI